MEFGRGPHPQQVFLNAVVPTAIVVALVISLGGLLIVLHERAHEAFHLAVDIVEAGVALSAFALAWFSRRFGVDQFLLLIGTAALGLGILEILPILTTLNSLAVAELDQSLATIGTDALLGITLVVLTGFTGGRTALLGLLGFQALWVGGLSVTMLSGLPVQEVGSLVFEIASFGSAALFALTLYLLHRNRRRFDRAVFIWLVGAASFSLFGIMLRLWTPDPMLAEHLGELVSRLCLLMGIVATAMARPQAMIAAALQRERQLSDQLAQDAQLLETILDATPDLVYLRSRDGRYSYVNPAGAEVHGVPRERWKGRMWRELGLSAELLQTVERQVAKVMRSGEPAISEGELRGRRYEYRMTPLTDAEGRVQRILSVARDITEQAVVRGALRESVQEAEQARRASEQASEARTRFLAAASHDLRQPLQAIRLYLDLLSLRLKNGEHSDLVRRARESLDSGEVLLKSLLDLSTLLAGIVTPRFEDFPVVRILEKLATEGEEFASRKGIALRVVASSATVRSDPVLLQRILRNLLVNAIRYTGAGGKVLIGCRHCGSAIRIDVIDTGIGIPSDQLELIFEEFYQIGTRQHDVTSGIGLGLSIVRRTALLLEHPVDVASIPGRGSRFSITVPVVATNVPEVRGSASEINIASGNSRLVLVIEDDGLQLGAIEEFVRAWGYEPVCAESGEKAVELVQGGCTPDAIITDYRLPGPLSGIDAVARIRSILNRAIPAVLATGDTAPERLRAANRAEMVILHKPYHAEALHEILSEMLSENPQ